ncbi:MAG: GDP-mannose 4,6-dehydratase [Nitrospinae bacterium]|nr:GDP-mannose 4,6-dehydratase [Nitrospinota bacterium]
MRVLITGITGFVGSHLSEFLIKKGFEVFGTTYSGKALPSERIKIFNCDIRDAAGIKNIVSDIKPHRIYNLSGISFPPDSFKNPRMTFDINFYGTMNLIEAVRGTGLDSNILFVGSSDEYGVVADRYIPISEECLLNPLSPYAASKAAADLLSYSCFKTYGMNIVRVRPFNHTGPGQRYDFVCSDFARQIAEIESGIRKPVIYTGNLDVERDFSDVRDIVSAYYLALEKGVSGDVYNICSERAYSIRWILHTLLGFTKLSVEIKEDPSKMRAADIKILKGDCSKFKMISGWKPAIPFEKTLRDLLDYWREKTSNR